MRMKKNWIKVIEERAYKLRKGHSWSIIGRGRLVKGAYRCLVCGYVCNKFWLIQNEQNQKAKISLKCLQRIGLKPVYSMPEKLYMPNVREAYWYKQAIFKCNLNHMDTNNMTKVLGKQNSSIHKLVNLDSFDDIVQFDLAESIDLEEELKKLNRS